MIGIGRIVTRQSRRGATSRSLWAVDLILLGCSVCVTVVAAQRGSERYVVPSTLLCRWNTHLLFVDGEDHGESYLALLEALCFVIAGRMSAIIFTC